MRHTEHDAMARDLNRDGLMAPNRLTHAKTGPWRAAFQAVLEAQVEERDDPASGANEDYRAVAC